MVKSEIVIENNLWKDKIYPLQIFNIYGKIRTKGYNLVIFGD